MEVKSGRVLNPKDAIGNIHVPIIMLVKGNHTYMTQILLLKIPTIGDKGEESV